MKRFAWTWGALVIVALLAIFTFYDGQRLKKKEEVVEAQKAVVKLKVDELTRIEIVTRASTMILDKAPEEKGRWRVLSPYQDEADQVAVESLLQQIEAEKSLKTVAEGADIDLKAFGLDDPVTRLKLFGPNGQSAEIRIGSVKAYDSNLYAQIGDESRVFLVGQSWDPLLAKLPKEYRNKRPLRQSDLQLADIGRVVFAPGSGAKGFEIVRDGEAWKLKGTLDFPVDKERVLSFFERLQAFRALDFLEGRALARAEAVLTKNSALRLEIFRATEAGAKPAFWMKIAPDTASKEGEYFGRSSDVSGPMALAQGAVDIVDKSPQDFYDRKLPFRFTAAEVERIEVDVPEMKAAFEKKGDAWILSEVPRESSHSAQESRLPKKADSNKLGELVTKLSRMEAFRILGTHSLSKTGSRLVLKKADGSTLFEFAWGEPEIEKARGAHPEARYLVAATKTATGDYRIGISEGEIQNLGLAALIQADASSQPAQGAH